MDGRLLLSGLVAAALMVHLVRFGFTTVFFVITVAFGVLLYETNRRLVSRKSVAETFRDAKAELRKLVRAETRLKYIFVDERLPKELIGMRHVRRFVKSSFDRYAELLEKFAKVYYNVLAGRFDPHTNLGILEDLLEDTEEVFDHLLLSTPRYSSKIYRYGSRSLHDVLRAHHGEISRILQAKMKRVVNQTKKRASI